ncbi:hypothetical protein [Psychromicrobium lacuslunae]|uniref:Phage ABA sandwich domain-containing protein n=1 Tax=Psychromicrobium lacuslunae TaxID=1618207 RepID=A0A0D4C1W3_9MICC|nr:hypothetical protein [Psychromicrobium lacuslunae]AJT42405.1 hypothetical protein UM93_14510 [Psychromicrobium lacuslunae]
MTATERLRDLLTVEAAATPGPWTVNGFDCLVDADGEPLLSSSIAGDPWVKDPKDDKFIIEARNNLQPLTQAVLDVLKVHRDGGVWEFNDSRDYFGDDEKPHWCKGCDDNWPCPTVQAITKHLGDNDE